jgi:hypothetical protein
MTDNFTLGNANAPRTVAIKSTTIEGQTSNNYFHGRVKVRYAGGATFDGTYCNSMRHGPGVITYPSGVVITGTWKNNKRFGHFIEEHPSGYVQHSEYKNDLLDGEMLIVTKDAFEMKKYYSLGKEISSPKEPPVKKVKQ